MATLHLMVGLPYSGKTTRDRELAKAHHALRLTPDEWHIRLFGHDFGEGMDDAERTQHDDRHAVGESLMWEVAARVLVLGMDVVLDLGCWVKSQRDEFRSKAHDLGAGFKIHFTHALQDVLLERLKARNAHLPDCAFYILETELKEWMQVFEPPTHEELE